MPNNNNNNKNPLLIKFSNPSSSAKVIPSNGVTAHSFIQFFFFISLNAIAYQNQNAIVYQKPKRENAV
jgi:hypothetical protein